MPSFSSLLGLLMETVLVLGWIGFAASLFARKRGARPPTARREPVALLGAMGAVLVATTLVVSTAAGAAVALLLFATGTAIRVRAEERLLAATFGERFDDYRARVPAVLPWRFDG